jgi:hypothetical protein
MPPLNPEIDRSFSGFFSINPVPLANACVCSTLQWSTPGRRQPLIRNEMGALATTDLCFAIAGMK